MVDEFHADKYTCSSLDSRPNSSNSNSSVQTHMNSTRSNLEAQNNDMDTSSSASASSRSEGDPKKDSTNKSFDSDDLERQYYRQLGYYKHMLCTDRVKFVNIIQSLSGQTEPSSQLAALIELCEVLSFSTVGSVSTMTSNFLSPLLVNLAKHESNPEIMLLAARAITHICDVYPQSAGLLVRHDAVPALCQRLLAIEYLDVAEQCLQALEKISQEDPLACLQAGAIMAVQNYRLLLNKHTDTESGHIYRGEHI